MVNDYLKIHGDNLLAFFTGGIPATIVGWNYFDNVLIPIAMTIITGFIGGMAAILGKMFVTWCLGVIKKYRK